MDRHFETFSQVCDERLRAKHGYWRPVVERSLVNPMPRLVRGMVARRRRRSLHCPFLGDGAAAKEDRERRPGPM